MKVFTPGSLRSRGGGSSGFQAGFLDEDWQDSALKLGEGLPEAPKGNDEQDAVHDAQEQGEVKTEGHAKPGHRIRDGGKGPPFDAVEPSESMKTDAAEQGGCGRSQGKTSEEGGLEPGRDEEQKQIQRI